MRKKIVLAISLLLFSILFVTAASALPPPLQKRVFIHYRRGYGKPDGTPGKGPKPPKEEDHSDHYKLLAKGAKWKELPIEYVVDPEGSGLTAEFVSSAIAASAQEWDDHTSVHLFTFGGVVSGATWDDDAPDDSNEVLFGDYPERGVIAVTVIWGYFSGHPRQREIIEFDIMFDTDYTWGNADDNPSVMDLQNIATHELGHGAGLADIYDCPLETMYGYADYGETIKRDLYDGDIAGIQSLYGA